VRTGMLKMLEHSRRYRCGKCGQEKEVSIDVEMRSATLAPPSFCGGPGAGPDGFCGGKSFSKVDGSEVCRDYQEIKIQEQVQHLGIGSMPRGIMVLLHDDLVDSCKPGDDVRITGVPLRRWKPLMKGARADAELVIVCNAVDVAHDKGSSSCAIRSVSCCFCPHIHISSCISLLPFYSFALSNSACVQHAPTLSLNPPLPVTKRVSASRPTGLRTPTRPCPAGAAMPSAPQRCSTRHLRSRDDILGAIAPQLCGMHTVRRWQLPRALLQAVRV
jgi:hypothetical protein